MLFLVDEALGWMPGDRLVVSSTDYSMYQAEEFSILPCATCTANQVKVEGQCVFFQSLTNTNHSESVCLKCFSTDLTDFIESH